MLPCNGWLIVEWSVVIPSSQFPKRIIVGNRMMGLVQHLLCWRVSHSPVPIGQWNNSRMNHFLSKPFYTGVFVLTRCGLKVSSVLTVNSKWNWSNIFSSAVPTWLGLPITSKSELLCASAGKTNLAVCHMTDFIMLIARRSITAEYTNLEFFRVPRLFWILPEAEIQLMLWKGLVGSSRVYNTFAALGKI